jgi:GNAT superfamily N-acetyltransferase
LDAADLRAVLPVLLAEPGSGVRAGQQPVRGFLEYLKQTGIEWEGVRCGPRECPSAVLLALVLPGRTGIVMIPSPGEHGIERPDQLRATEAGMARLSRRELHYVQALLEPQAAGKQAVLKHIGFRPLAPLVYLERDATYPWVEPPTDADAEWVPYSAGTHGEFGQVVLATYENSWDCPELTGLRPIDDILASHKASGRFDPQLWELARIQGRAAGCLLLAQLVQAPLVEIVYMGVVSEFRRQGVGRLLLRRALAQCRAVGAGRLTVVVDDRNAPAKRLYGRFALLAVASRDAWFYRWQRA